MEFQKLTEFQSIIVTHVSTNLARRSLTSVIGRERGLMQTEGRPAQLVFKPISKVRLYFI